MSKQSKSASTKSRKKKRSRKLQFWLLQNVGCHLIAWGMHALKWTLRKRYHNAEIYEQVMRGHGRAIFAFWHEDLVCILMCHRFGTRHRRCDVMLSPSNDAEALRRAIGWFGLGSVRGSAFKRSTAGLKELVERVETTANAVIALDGSRGPRREVQPGALLVAKHARAPIIPVSFESSSHWRVKSWDKTKIPKPFSRIDATLYPPILPDESDGKAEFEMIGVELHETLMKLAQG